MPADFRCPTVRFKVGECRMSQSTVSEASLSFTPDGPVLASPWSAPALGEVRINGEPVAGPWRAGADGEFYLEHGAWRITANQEQGALQFRIRNIGRAPQALDTVTAGRWPAEVFAPRWDTAEFRELVHNSSFLEGNAGVKPVGRKTGFLDFTPVSGLFTVYARHDGGALLLGVLPPLGEAFSEFRSLHSEPHFEADFGCEIRFVFQCRVAPGDERATSPVAALAGAAGTELMQHYGALWKARGRPPRLPPRIGWNSWDFWAGAVTREAVDQAIEAGRRLFGDALECFVLDEGWECQWGTWKANWKFPEGLEDFCRHVRKHGGTPGIWTAPLLVNTYNPLYLEHPDWFAAGADGQVRTDLYSYGPMAYLDLTRPEVLEHLQRVFRELRRAGFEYFKVDFTQCILKAARFHDPGVGRNALIRRAFSAIRRAIGEETYLLACGAPYESVAGLVDAVRVTGDIHVFWGHVLRNAGAIATRWWMAGNLWNTDPDFLVVRGPDTAAPPYTKRGVTTPLGPGGGWMAGRVFSENEARAYALLVHLSGGDVMLGDVLDRLRPAGIEILRRVLTPRAQAAVPVDLFSAGGELPQIWISRGPENTLVGLFNWQDVPGPVDFDPGRWGLHGTPRDFWTDAPVETPPRRLARRSAVGLVYPA